MSTGESYRYYEVCIVGSGFAGAIIGKSLAENGINTVIIESGTDNGIKNSCMKSVLTGLDVYENTEPINYPIAESRSRRLGGTSNTWTGRSPMFHPVDFEINAYTPSDAVWRLSYGELEPYYEMRAEKT